MLKVADVPAGRREDFNKTEAVAGNIIMPSGVLLGIGDEERATDVLNIKGSKVVRNIFGLESVFAKVDALEIGVIHFHARGAEICDVEEFLTLHLGRGHPLVDCAVVRAVVGIVHFEDGIGDAGRRVDARVPPRDGAVFRGKNEDGLLTWCQEEIRRAPVENEAGWSRLGARRETWRRNGNDERPTLVFCWLWIPIAIVQSGRAGIVVGDPPRAAARVASQPPRSLKVGIKEDFGLVRVVRLGNVGNQILLPVMLRGRYSGEQ